ncbi:helix-turn-helix domain-containing protein [Brevundimonas sp.]|uniref:helix-turn-helix domain-containing protein n=1 Tax=Brevundimonas sp. TaxID=1871086 RepID=UPI0025D563E2|nr:helix-turn-helix domain-containing protein [Brevundimonas sp.]
MTVERDFEAEFEAFALELGSRRTPLQLHNTERPKQPGTVFLANKLRWIEQLTLDASLSRGALRMGLRLSSYLNATTGEAWPCQTTLAADLGVSKRAVTYAADELKAKGHLTWTRPNKRAPNRYRPKLHEAKQGFRSSADLRRNPPAPHTPALRRKSATPTEEAEVRPIPLKESSEVRSPRNDGTGTVVPRRQHGGERHAA